MEEKKQQPATEFAGGILDTETLADLKAAPQETTNFKIPQEPRLLKLTGQNVKVKSKNFDKKRKRNRLIKNKSRKINRKNK